jgi:hypothetical protein
MNGDLHPLAVPFPPLQRVGLFAAGSVRALAEFTLLNAAAHECVTQMGVAEKALPAALRIDAPLSAHASVSQRADAIIKAALQCDSLVDDFVAAAKRHGIAANELDYLAAFRAVSNMPGSCTLASQGRAWALFALSYGLQHKGLAGHVELHRLPSTLQALDLNWNSLSGALSLDCLPPTLTRCELHNNRFSGEVDLSALPATLTLLDVHANSLSGELDLTRLPGCLSVLDVSGNNFAGAVDLDHLPKSMRKLWLQNNVALSGTLASSASFYFSLENTQIVRGVELTN